ncbi:MAG: glycosyltransferase family 1 protein [Chloroflexi bacterium]|nr:MAG: glycosyltransferase family 1 protein [Chloroflexota bacterium]
MRVLMLSWEFPPHIVGGLGKHVADLAPALAQAGLDIHVVTPDLRGGPSVEQICAGATVYRVPTADRVIEQQSVIAFSQTSNLYLERKAWELASTLGGFDIIHGHDWLVAYASVAIKYALKRPLVVTVHSMERGRMQGTLVSEQSLAINGAEWWLTYEAWRVITVSHYMAQQVSSYFSIPADKLDVIYNGVMKPQNAPLGPAERAAFRQTYAAPDEKIAYYVGRLVHEKGVHVLIEAAPLILSKQPHIKFLIAGTGVYTDVLRQLVEERGVAANFIFTGFITDDVRDKLYQVADVAVFPSLYEPFGIVALEAMAHGCPVVVSETGGLAEFVTAHETGILTRCGDPESLAWGVLHTLQNPVWTARRVANALRMVEEVYNWQRIAGQTANTYCRVHDEWQASDWGQ